MKRRHICANFIGSSKPDGVLSLTEMAGDPDKLDVEDIRSLGEAAGFAICGRFGGKWNYTVNLGKRSRSDRGEESPR